MVYIRIFFFMIVVVDFLWLVVVVVGRWRSVPERMCEDGRVVVGCVGGGGGGSDDVIIFWELLVEYNM